MPAGRGPMAGDGILPHGWTPARIDRVARLAARSWYRPSDLSFDDALEVALHVIGECLALGVTGQAAILRRANVAIQSEARAQRMYHGFIAHEGGRRNAGWPAYWLGSRPGSRSFADDLTERIAITQVYWALPPRWQQVILREAWDYDRHLHYRSEVQQARRAARRLYYDHESDPGHYRRRTAA